MSHPAANNDQLPPITKSWVQAIRTPRVNWLLLALGGVFLIAPQVTQVKGDRWQGKA